MLGRPGAVLHSGDLVGLWRPRKVGTALRPRVEPRAPLPASARARIEEQAALLAEHRGVRPAGVDFLD